MKLLVSICLIFSFSILLGQKKTIDHNVYNSWKSVQSSRISKNGTTVTFEVNPQAGNSELHILNGDKEKIISKGKSAEMSANGNTIIYSIKPDFDSIRNLKIKKTKKADFPIDSVGVYVISADSTFKFDKVKSYDIAKENSEWLYIKFDDKDRFAPKKNSKKKKKCFLKKKKDSDKPTITDDALPLLLFNPLTGHKLKLNKNNEVRISEKGKWIGLVYNYQFNDSIDSTNVDLYNTNTGKLQSIYSGLGLSKTLVFNKQETKFGFLHTKDTSKIKDFNYYEFEEVLGLSQPIDTSKFTKGWVLNHHHSPYYSAKSKSLFFETYPKPKKEAKDTLPEDEKAVLDVWSWTDDRLQTDQLNRVEKEKIKGYLNVLHFENKNQFQLEDTILNLDINENSKHEMKFVLAQTQKPYLKEISWTGWFFDYYRVNIETGEVKKLLSHHQHSTSLHPNGNQFAYWQHADSSWQILNVKTGVIRNITKNIPHVFYDESHDSPMDVDAYGLAGWTKDNKLIVYDKYDAWVITTENLAQKPKNLTNGRNSNWSHRYWKTNKKEQLIDLSGRTNWTAFNLITKDVAVKSLENNKWTTLMEESSKIVDLKISKNRKKIIYRTSTFQKYPDLFLTDINFTKPIQITNANPQQKEFNWGTVEQVKWTSFEGLKLDGLLYKPENFDPNKKYPLMVYFYETYSDNLHNHYVPKPTASIIYATEYVSNGYCVFMPDIKYKDGHPAKSAYDCIVSGTDYITQNNAFIDTTRMALQGQSWGGYQTAMLVTMTDKYRCGMAGAPVSNMTSAYGGIRWGSGMSRMFQYEKMQSRIGATLWEKPELYIENSPLFFANKVNTPLLIMHNDKDGAVPWYQGIEYFVALRRLGKPSWMLNYNGDAHNLRKRANKMDLSIRMRQFFDYYLLDKPAPKWMLEGVPALDKGVEYGLELKK